MDTPFMPFIIEREQLRNRPGVCYFDVLLDNVLVPASLADGNDVSGLYEIAGYVHLVSVDQEMTVPDELPGLVSADTDPQPVGDAVQSSLKKLQKVVPGLSRHFRSSCIEPAELGLVDPVEAPQFLLLPETDPVLSDLCPAVLSMLPGFEISLVDRTLFRVAPVALQKKLCAFSSAKTADSTCISAHFPIDLPVRPS